MAFGCKKYKFVNVRYRAFRSHLSAYNLAVGIKHISLLAPINGICMPSVFGFNIGESDMSEPFGVFSVAAPAAAANNNVANAEAM